MADAGFSLRVEGENSFYQALLKIDAQVKANKNTLRGLTAEYNLNGGSLDALRQKSDVLQGSITTQAQKIDILAKQYAESAERSGAASKATLDLKVKLEAAKATLSELNASLAENAKAITDAQTVSVDYTSSLEGIDARLAENASKLELVTARYGGKDQATARATQSEKILTDSIAQQNEKLAVLKTQLAAAEAKYGTGSTEATKYRTAINKAEVEITGLNTKLEQTKKSMTGTSDATSALTKGLTSVASQFGINLPPALTGATDKLDGFTVAGALAVTTLLAIGKNLVQFSIDASNAADEILTLSSTTGMTTDKIQELKYASDLVDTSFETVSGATTKMIRTMSDAKTGTAAAQEAFRALHIRVTDTNDELRDANEVFYQVIDRLGKMKNETDRDALAMEIFGKSARELNPLIEAGSEKLRQLAEEAHNTGYVMSEQTLAKYGALNDELVKMGTAGDAAKNSLGMVLVPMLTSLFGTISEMNPETLKTIVIITSIVAGIIALVTAIKKVTDTANTISGFFSTMSTGASKTTLIILGIVAALIALGIIIAVIIGRGGELKQSFNSMGQSVAQVQASVQNAQTGAGGGSRFASVPHWACGTDNHPGGYAVVGEEGPELVELPAGRQGISQRGEVAAVRVV